MIRKALPVAVALALSGCSLDLTGALCQSDQNCPRSQFCRAGTCQVGPRTDAGGTELSFGPFACSDGIDNDGDGKTDCADSSCDGLVCRPSSGGCDAPESCSNGVCPADQFLPATTVCRPGAGDCDVAESCTGTSAQCPADIFAPATTACRASAGVCDVAES